jgi:Uri superfamily endonuclease
MMKKPATDMARQIPRWVSPPRIRSLLRGNPPLVYQLLIRLDQPVPIRIVSLGPFTLPPGWYVYSGSARRASAARLARHLRKRKTRRWHIDYLLTQPHARVVAVRLWRWQPGLECAVNQALVRSHRASPAIPGFGSSDCRKHCPAHLLFLRDPPPGITDA